MVANWMRARASAIEQLTTGAVAITMAERERELVERTPESVPMAEMLTLLRVMQQGLILALSHDPEVRARAVDAYTVMMYGRLAEQPWKAELKARAEGRR